MVYIVDDFSNNVLKGGFGGGGSADYENACNLQGGPGGGYTGASGTTTTLTAIGQGGGSYSAGIAQVNKGACNTGDGAIKIVYAICKYCLHVFFVCGLQ